MHSLDNNGCVGKGTKRSTAAECRHFIVLWPADRFARAQVPARCMLLQQKKVPRLFGQRLFYCHALWILTLGLGYAAASAPSAE